MANTTDPPAYFQFTSFRPKRCSSCYKSEADGVLEYDLCKMALDLERGEYKAFFCYGCRNRGVLKDREGNLFLAKQNPAGQIDNHPVSITDFM